MFNFLLFRLFRRESAWQMPCVQIASPPVQAISCAFMSCQAAHLTGDNNLTLIEKTQKTAGVAECDRVGIAAVRCCQGHAGLLTLVGKLTLKNADEVSRQIRTQLFTVNAALLDVTHLINGACTSPFMSGDRFDSDAAIILLVTRAQRSEYEPYMQERTSREQVRMIFTDDQLVKARDWLSFYSRLEMPI